jgi:predicted transposase/invertase (TIGR01784 family)
MLYLDPKNDLTFKKVFGEHPHLLKSFLNALLPLAPDAQIESLDYLPAELIPEVLDRCNSLVDVRCVDQKGRQFIVEMQMLWTDSFMSRVLFNASKAYVKQLRIGQDDKLLQPVYSLNLVDETFIKDNPDWYHHYKIVNIANTERRIEGLEFVFVELPKFRPQTLPEKKLQVLWLRYLTEVGEETRVVPEELRDNQEVQEAIEYLRESAFTPAEMETYEKYWDSIRVERTRIADAWAEGEAVGEARGMEKGIALGENKIRLKTALALLHKGMDPSEIADITGLSAQDLANISAGSAQA